MITEKIYLIWTIQSVDQWSWFSDEIQWCFDAARHSKGALPSMEIQVYITKGEGANNGFMINGRPEYHKIIDDIYLSHYKRATTVFACGPTKMVNDLWDACNEKKRDGHPFNFHHETFEF